MNTGNSNDYMLQKKIELMIDMNSKKLMNEIANINNAIAKLNEQIETIKKNIHDKPTVKIEPIQQIEKPQVEMPHSQQGSSPAAYSVRTGNFKPEDVSVEKFFNFGKR